MMVGVMMMMTWMSRRRNSVQGTCVHRRQESYVTRMSFGNACMEDFSEKTGRDKIEMSLK